MDSLPRIGHVVITKVAEYKRRGKLLELPPTEPNVIIFDDGSGSESEAVDIHIDQTTPMTSNDAGSDPIADPDNLLSAEGAVAMNLKARDTEQSQSTGEYSLHLVKD